MVSSEIDVGVARRKRRPPPVWLALGVVVAALAAGSGAAAGSLLPPSAGAVSRPRTDVRPASATGLGTRLGPTDVSNISFPVLLRSSQKPTCLEGWAVHAHLSVRWTNGQSWVVVNGTPAAIDRGFAISIDNYRSSDGRVVYASDRPATVPPAVCREVAAVGVIHSFVPPTTYDVPGSGLLPQQLATTYDAAPLLGQGLRGQGETVVLFEVDGFSVKDLQSFAKLLPVGSQGPFDVDVVGGNPSLTSGQASESTMDIETVHEVAPDAKIVYVNLTSPLFNGNTTAATFIAAFQLADKQWPGAIWSVSLGICETGGAWDTADLVSMNDAISAAEDHGTTLFAASGDGGDSTAPPPPRLVSHPRAPGRA